MQLDVVEPEPLVALMFARDNTHGLLGNGALADYSGPVAVAGDSSYTDITVGTDHACGLLTDGSVECWGESTLVTLLA